MKIIKKIKLHNFKRFKEFSVDFDDELNLLIGDNESGKSTILTAIDIALSGNISKVEGIGLENLFCVDTVNEFLCSDKKFENLPVLFVEIYLNEQNNPDLNGRNNSDEITTDGLKLMCEPNEEHGKDIKEILDLDESNFPFEFYSINFRTFAGENYTGYKRYLKHIQIDNSQISDEYASKSYVKSIYNSYTIDSEKNRHKNMYRQYKKSFKTEILKELNDRIKKYDFEVKTSKRSNLETDLTISENGIYLENRGRGRQCFIKAELALNKNDNKNNLDVILFEEPENHLSHINMKKLIRHLINTSNMQLFIATHNNLISTRLDLRKSILLNSNDTNAVLLRDLPESTANFFIKASNNNILEFILSKKVILVEGDAEYILMDSFYQKITDYELGSSDIHVISVGGTSFKRYLDIAKILNIKTAVVRDNDKDYIENCVENYSEYTSSNIRVFSENDNEKYTFEVSIFMDNEKVCCDLFAAGRRTLSVQDYMLQNKADVAFEILDKKANEVIPPIYIKEAIEWINE